MTEPIAEIFLSESEIVALMPFIRYAPDAAQYLTLERRVDLCAKLSAAEKTFPEREAPF